MQRLRRLFVALGVFAAVFATVPTAAFAVSAQNSSVVRATFPTTMVANTTYRAVVTMRNTGSATWLSRYSYGLRALGNSDPFTRTRSFGLSKTEKITRGRNRIFVIMMKAPATPGTYVTDWRMYTGRHTGFGAVVVRRVIVVPATLSSIAITKLPTKLHYLTGEVLDLSGMVVTGSYNDGTTKVLPVTAADVTGFNTNAASISELLTITLGGKSATFSIDVTEKKPVISAVHFESNSARGKTVAQNGDILTLTFTSDEPVTKLSNFKINGSNPDSFTNVGNVYTATHKVDAGDPVTGAPATFQINVKNALGIYSQTIEQTNDGSSVTIDPVVLTSISVSNPPTKVHYLTGEALDLSGMVVTGTYSDGSTSIITVAAADVTGFSSNAAAAAQVLTVTSGGKTATFTVDITEKKPAISAVHFSSNSAKGSTVAYGGDTITLTFTSDEPVEKLSNFKINGSNPDTFTHVGNVYTATHLVDAGDPVTGAPATFQINVKNALGIYSQTVEVTNDGSSVTIVDPKPVISAVHFESNSAKGSSVAYNGDMVTLSFSTDEPISKLSNFKINGSNPDTFTMDAPNHYVATHIVDAGDAITGAPATFQINVKNAAGIYSQTIEVTNDGSSVTIVDPKPVISNVHIAAAGLHGGDKASVGDVVILTFTSDEPVTKLSNFKINGSNPDTFMQKGNVYIATHLVDSGDLITGVPATFQINVKNVRGIYSQTIEQTSDGSSVTIIP